MEGLFVGSDSATRHLRLPEFRIAGLAGRAMREVILDVAEQLRIAWLQRSVMIRRKLPRDLVTRRHPLGRRVEMWNQSSLVVCHMSFPIK